MGSIAKGFGSGNTTLSRDPLGRSTDANFGAIDITARPGRTPRYMQLSMKVIF